MRRFVHVLFLLGSLAMTGCASIVTGQNQSISVATISNSGQLSEAKCQLSNNKGTWFVTTPGSTSVQRSYEDMALRCEHPQFEPGLTTVKSSTKGMAFGNLLFGGIIGAGADISTGAAYDYPPLITVAMGRPIGVGPPGAAPLAGEQNLALKGAASALRPGDAFEYEVTDLFTKIARKTRLQVERIDGSMVVFAGGNRVEQRDGTLVRHGHFGGACPEFCVRGIA